MGFNKKKEKYVQTSLNSYYKELNIFLSEYGIVTDLVSCLFSSTFVDTIIKNYMASVENCLSSDKNWNEDDSNAISILGLKSNTGKSFVVLESIDLSYNKRFCCLHQVLDYPTFDYDRFDINKKYYEGLFIIVR